AGWFVAQLGLATGIMSSAIPAGQSLFVPVGTALVPEWGWRMTYLALALAVPLVAAPLLALLVRDPPKTDHDEEDRHARIKPHLDIWLVGIGYFGCGFSDQFVSLHLVALASDSGIEPLLAAGLL